MSSDDLDRVEKLLENSKGVLAALRQATADLKDALDEFEAKKESHYGGQGTP